MTGRANRNLPVLLLAGLCLLASSAWAHRFHVSLAEAAFNDSSQRLEVALSVSVHDMEEALLRQDELADPESDSVEPQQQLSNYVMEHWNVVSADGQVRNLDWIGSQVEGELLWLYFEIKLPGGLEGARIDNQMFFELDARQVNTVNFREGDWQFSSTYSRDHRVLPISREGE